MQQPSLLGTEHSKLVDAAINAQRRIRALCGTEQVNEPLAVITQLINSYLHAMHELQRIETAIWHQGRTNATMVRELHNVVDRRANCA